MARSSKIDEKLELALDRELFRRGKGLRRFVSRAWNTIENRPFVGGWHVDCICDHLEAVHCGQIDKAIINIPPRMSKSTICSVMFPAWSWLSDPWLQWLSSTYSFDLTKRDSLKTRKVIQGKYYQAVLEDPMTREPDWTINSDQNQVMRFSNTQNGYRLATSTGGKLTGEGGDRIIIDDPHNVVETESPTDRQSKIQWFDEAMSTRYNDPNHPVLILVMQRLHEDDLTGHILALDIGAVHVCLPMEYSGKNRIITPLDWKDPRTENGELLCPDRMPKKYVEDTKKSLGPYASAGQLQQDPAPREGGMFDPRNWVYTENLDPRQIERSVCYWDKAASVERWASYTVGLLMHRLKNGHFVIDTVIRGKWPPVERDRIMRQTAQAFKDRGLNVYHYVEQEAGSGGKESAQSTILNMAGFKVEKDRVTGDKVERADPLSGQQAAQNVYLLRHPEWNKPFVDELQLFPNGKYRDQADAASGAFNKLILDRKKKAGTWRPAKAIERL